MDEEEEDDHIEPPVPALFTLDLGANGGIFSPTTAEEALAWVQREINFWSWTQNVQAGNHKNIIDSACHPLHYALAQAREAVQYLAQSNEGAVRERIAQVQSQVQEAFLNRKLPHSTTALGQRVAALKVDPRAAIAYLLPFLPSTSGQDHQFDARDVSSWRGFVMGLMDRFSIVSDVEPKIQAERVALEDLHARAEKLFGDKKAAIEQLHREFVSTTDGISGAKTAQQEDFDTLVLASETAHKLALKKHESEMENLAKTFREKMKLRGPVEYWTSKAKVHQDKAKLLMKWVFGSMAGLAGIIGGIAFWMLKDLADKTAPESWKVAVLVLVGVIGVWAVRLIVRMFLSHTHLATDAEERVTMVQTYLALLEGEKMPADEDRKLVLAPLFRPASDGMVKDEGMPHPMLELFTRTGPR